MAKRLKYKPEDFPNAGTVFTVPLADGRVGVCRVVRFMPNGGNGGSPSALIAASDWISDSPPLLRDPAVRRILILNHHKWTTKPQVEWVGEPPPPGFQVLGQIEVIKEDKDYQCSTYGSWSSVSLQVLLQWGWDNEREAVLAEDSIKNQARIAGQDEIQRVRSSYLNSVSFPQLLSKELFPTWDDYPAKHLKEGTERIVHLLIHSLAIETQSLDRPFVTTLLKACVQSLNEFASSNGDFIETVEREDLILLLEEILNAAKMPELVDIIDDWRNW